MGRADAADRGARRDPALARRRAGDRVVGYLPNVPEAIVAFLATVSIGAVWSACGQDIRAPAALDRLGQLEPTVLVAADGYRFGGKEHPRTARSSSCAPACPRSQRPSWSRDSQPASARRNPVGAGHRGRRRARTGTVPFDHPCGSSSRPARRACPRASCTVTAVSSSKHLKAIALQSDIGRDDTFFWYTSPSWMMWNFQVAGLLVGATVVCYDGSPAYPAQGRLWDRRPGSASPWSEPAPATSWAVRRPGSCRRRSTTWARSGRWGSPGPRCRRPRRGGCPRTW